MLKRTWSIGAMVALLLGGAAGAQQPGTLILGGFGQYTLFDDNLGFEDAFGYGGRMGAFISPNAFLEAEGSYTEPDWAGTGKARYGPISARLMFAFPFSSMTGINAGFQVGGGAVLSSYRRGEGGYRYNYGAEGALGFTAAFGGFTALRMQALVDYMPQSEPDATMNFRFQAGLDFWPDPASQWMGMAPTAAGPVVWWDDTPQPLPGTLEVGGFGQWTWFDESAGRCTPGDPCTDAVPEDGLGYGGRLGVFLTPNWQLEGDGYYSPQDRELTEEFCCTAVRPSQVNASAFALRMNYNIPMGGRSQFIIGGGAVRTNYRFEREGTDEDIFEGATYNYGASGLVGLRVGIANRTAIRLDGVVDYMPNATPEANMNIHARAGLSFLLGGASRVVPEPPAVCAWNSSILASDPNCRAPAPPPPPPPAPAARCVYNNNILATDPNCRAPVAIDTTAITAPIYFDFDKSDIRPDAAATLDRKIPWLQANPGMRIRIEGNADNRGSDEYNLALGQRRAASARQYLVDRGIDTGRFDLVSYGEERPVCSETPMTEACHQLNRRDDFRIVTIGGDGRIRTP